MAYSYYKIGPNVVNGHTFTISDRYTFMDAKILGRGSFGVVTTSVDTETNKVIAIKRIRPYANDDWDARHTLREIRLMRFLGPHPNVISLYNLSLYDEKSELYMMMELMDCDLHRVIQSKQTLTPKHFKCFLKQILEGVKAMHEVGIFHRDLKPGNILVSKDCQIRITDFGLARFMDESTRQGNNKVNPMTQYVVTRWYRAPELLLNPDNPYDEAIDLWSIGCILAELYRRKPLFPGKSHAHQVQMIFEVMGYNPAESLGFNITSEAVGFLEKRCIYRKQPLTNVVPGLSEDALDLLEDLLSVNPINRPTAVQAIKAKYLDDADVICDYTKKYVVRPIPKDFEFENAKYSLEELRGMILDEVKYYENNGINGGKPPARKNSGSGSYAIPIHGPTESFSTANSRKGSIVGSGEFSSRSSWDSGSNFSGKMEPRDEDGPVSQMQTTRLNAQQQNQQQQHNHLQHQQQQQHAQSYNSRSYIPTDKLLDKLSALRLSGGGPPLPNSNATTGVSGSSGSSIASYGSSSSSNGIANTSQVVPDTEDYYQESYSKLHHDSQDSKSRRNSIRGVAVGSIIASARNINSNSPNPRTPKTPSPVQAANTMNKGEKFRNRIMSTSNVTTSLSGLPTTSTSQGHSHSQGPMTMSGTNSHHETLSRSYNSKSSLAAAGAALLNGGSNTTTEYPPRHLDPIIQGNSTMNSTATTISSSTTNLTSSATAAASTSARGSQQTRKSSGDFSSIFSHLQGKYHGYNSKIGTSANSSDDDISECSDTAPTDRKVTTAPDSRRSSTLLSQNESIDHQQNRLKSFLGLSSSASASISSFGSNAKRF